MNEGGGPIPMRSKQVAQNCLLVSHNALNKGLCKRSKRWKGMKPCICICCGEPISQGGNRLSRNPNICPACSSFADTMDEGEQCNSLQSSLEAPLTEIDDAPSCNPS